MAHRINVITVVRQVRIIDIRVSKSGIRYVGLLIVAHRKPVIIRRCVQRAYRIILRIARLFFYVRPQVRATTAEIGENPRVSERTARRSRIIRRDAVCFAHPCGKVIIRNIIFYRRKLFKVEIAPFLIGVDNGKLVLFARLYRKRQNSFAVNRIRRIVNRLFLFVTEVFADLQRNGNESLLFVNERRAFERIVSFYR